LENNVFCVPARVAEKPHYETLRLLGILGNTRGKHFCITCH
jgi:hypothetical protein